MSFAGLKQKAAEADEAARRAQEQELFARVADHHKFAEEAVAAAERAAGADPGARRAKVMQLEEGRDAKAPRHWPGPMGFGIEWDPLERGHLSGRGRAAFDLLERRREALPEGERFDIELKAAPVGFGHVGGWDMSIWITW